MFSYTKKSLYILTTIITFVVFFTINHTIFELADLKDKNVKIEPVLTKDDIDILEDDIILLSNKETIDENIWELEIPSINVKQVISEGTGPEVLKNTIGHFIESPILDGNVCLASHNRGNSGAFFGRIKELEPQDIIIYNVKGVKKIYAVFIKIFIKETDFSYIQNTRDDRITLITCVENKPELRCCVQGIRKEVI